MRTLFLLLNLGFLACGAPTRQDRHEDSSRSDGGLEQDGGTADAGASDGGEDTTDPDDGGGASDGGEDATDAGEPTPNGLLRVGPSLRTGHPGETLPLSAVLFKGEVGPVADQSVLFEIVDDDSGSELSADSVSTDGSGVAATQLRLGSRTGTMIVRAASDTAEEGVSWEIDVRPVVKRLRVVPDSITRLDVGDPSKATLDAQLKQQVSLRVRVSVESGEGERPLGGETVTFTIYQQSDATTALVGAAQVVTSASGEAGADLYVGDTTGATIVLASIAGNLSAQWTVHVKSSTSGGGCQDSAQCPAGFLCRAGVCTSSTGGGGCNTNDRPCPIGYMCNAESGMCELSVAPGCENCPEFFHCNDEGTACVPENPECDAEVPCPSGFECVNGLCAPDNDDSIDVSGYWYTTHKFDVRDALPGWVKFSADGIRIIDQILLGQLNLPSWANVVIVGIVKQYIPDWVGTLVGILDAAFTVFSELESEGEMDLSPNGSPSIVSGQEYWTKFVFHFLPLCNGNIQAPPGQQPPCARMDIYTDELEAADLAVDVKPFAARVGGDTSRYTMFVENRVVDMDFQGILLYVLNYAIQLSTGYASLEEALPELVDCEGVNQMVQDLGIGVDVTALCEGAVVTGTKAIVDQLKGANVTQKDTLFFGGSARVFPSQWDAGYAENLGYVDYLTRKPADGAWQGKLKAVLSVDDVPGRWRASREPLPR